MIKIQGVRELNTMTKSEDNIVKLEMSIDEQLNQLLGIVEQPKEKHDESTETRNQFSTLASIKTQLNQNKKFSRTKQPGSSLRRSCNQNGQKSHHHNLQKHTVTALRDIIKLQYFYELQSKGEFHKEATAIWKQFLNIRGKQVMTKKFLSILFSSQLNTVQLLGEYGFHKIYTAMNQLEILEGKIQLRKLVGYFLSNKAIDQHIQKRQIQRKQQFKLYLLCFREELESSDLKKRISKSVSRVLKSMAQNMT